MIVEKNQDWLTNSSFQVVSNERTEPDVEKIESSEDEPQTKQKKHSKKKKKKDHKHHKEKRAKIDITIEPKLEFTGKEDYYVDKKPCKSYFAMDTLRKDDSPRYRIHFHHIGTHRILHRRSKDKAKRYFTKYKSDKAKADGAEGAAGEKESSKTYRLNEEEFTAKTKILNRDLLSNSNDIDMWLEYVRFQEHFYMKMTKLQMAQRKMEILNKALKDNPSNERLYREYIDILEQAYPSFEVSKFLDNLIQKGMCMKKFNYLSKKYHFFHPLQFVFSFVPDPANYTLWNAQIKATQSSMARCKVPDVMALYEKCMKSMYKRNRCNEVTLSESDFFKVFQNVSNITIITSI